MPENVFSLESQTGDIDLFSSIKKSVTEFINNKFKALQLGEEMIRKFNNQPLQNEQFQQSPSGSDQGVQLGFGPGGFKGSANFDLGSLMKLIKSRDLDFGQASTPPPTSTPNFTPTPTNPAPTNPFNSPTPTNPFSLLGGR
jgi:hypothetical protein